MMKRFVVTGGIAVGKTAMLGCLMRNLPAETARFCSDDCVAGLYLDRAFVSDVQAAFGHQAVNQADGSDNAVVNKRWLRTHVLPVESQRLVLERLVHERVLAALAQAGEAARRALAKVFVAEVPLHYEIGEVVSADLVIVVAASRSVQVRRMMEHRGLDEVTTQAFLNAQWPIETKVEKADVVIWNDGDPSALECQTLLLANLLNLE